jgi:hypothetical protein
MRIRRLAGKMVGPVWRPASRHCMGVIFSSSESANRLGRNLRHLVNTIHDLMERGICFRVLTGQAATRQSSTASLVPKMSCEPMPRSCSSGGRRTSAHEGARDHNRPLINRQTWSQSDPKRNFFTQRLSQGVGAEQLFENRPAGPVRATGQCWISASQRYLKFADQAIWPSLSVG